MVSDPVRFLARRTSALPPWAKTVILVAVDAALVPLALLFALGVAPGAIGFAEAAVALPGLMVVAGALSYLLGPAQAHLREFDTRTARQIVALGLCLGLAAWLVWGARIGGAAAVLFGIGTCLGAIVIRIALREALVALYRLGGTAEPALIYGAGAAGRQLAVILTRTDAVHPVGFLDDDPALRGRTIAGLRVFPALQIDKIASARKTSVIYLAMPSAALPRRIAVTKRLQARGFEVRTAPPATQSADLTPAPGACPRTDARQLLARKQIAVDHMRLSLGYAGRSVLITGAGGSIGRELCRQVLACDPARIVMFDLSEAALFEVGRELAALSGAARIVPVLGSITDAALVRTVMAENRVDVVLHAAAYKHVPLVEANPLAGLANNALGTDILARASVAAGVDRFILISTDKAVAPVGAMGATKRLAECVVQSMAQSAPDTRFAIVRFGNVIGSSGSVVPVFREQIAAGGPVTLTDAAATRFFMSVEEAVRLVLVAGAITRGGETFVLDMGAPVQIGALARKMIGDAGLTLRDAAHPEGDIELQVVGLRPGERLHETDMSLGARPSGAHPLILQVAPAPLAAPRIAHYLDAARAAHAAADGRAALALIAAFLDEERHAATGGARQGDAPIPRHPRRATAAS